MGIETALRICGTWYKCGFMRMHLKLFQNILMSRNGSHATTVVSAYFNIGSFDKGDGGVVFTQELYHLWMTSFALIKNPVVVYLEGDEDIALFKQIRKVLPDNLTLVVKIQRNELWAFRLIPHIRKIFEKAFYPRHLPNTVVPAYSSAMHAKYELMLRTALNNPFETKYICWLDIGLFRDLATNDLLSNHTLVSSNSFRLSLPAEFDPHSVAYTEVEQRISTENVREIIADNLVWVCGCYFIGRVDVMLRWTKEYMTGVEDMLHLNEMSTDQQVIYWIFNQGKQVTKIQTFSGDGRFSRWFHLAYLSRDHTWS